MIDDGQKPDLYKLLSVVEGKGGFEAVCNGELWDLVGEECGLGVNVGSSVKLVFSKYKSVLESCLKKSGGGKVSDECGLMGFEADVKELLSGQAEIAVAGNGVKAGVDGANEVKSGEKDVGKLGEGNGDAMQGVEVADGGKKSNETTADVCGAVKIGASGLLNVGKTRDGDNVGDSSGGNVGGLKRKKESLCDLMNWVTRAANNPCDPEIGLLPEKSKWKSYSNQEAWKRVLLYREAVFHKKQSSIEQQNWQSQKMHPSMYDDPAPTTYNLRERVKRDKKQSFEKQKPGSQSSSGNSDRTSSPRAVDSATSKRILVGPNHQAEVPEWTGPILESDPKWLGTQIWPLVAANPRFLIERDPIGKGRQDSCGCAVPRSVECVRFHIAERKDKIKLELGMAFYYWDFDKVGEDVRRSWTYEDEKKFWEVIQSNPPSSERYFWDYIFRTFPNKNREVLVSYYFNVYLLHRIAYHSRHTPDDFDSDDDESQSALRNVFGHQTQNSLLSPKKPAKKGK
ncbi:AT-rich interactive domain-containing protein 1 isoform X1 [Trifolium pratense]|uniref:AT-rich interactive domain-containing protein 1 isoform X1 n=2 Tax=Trifolium pratense TaxID=57577 RepID=UPI001E695ADA|nr:AT-rich interactive domain-containing protein 1 isoform X1 [Trifolium pratense]XP_045791130.1 AT-rich interactive domain-containing protein 1 isoform X1 [Trifolium pratense]